MVSYKVRISSVSYEADLLRIVLVCAGDTGLLGDRSYFILGISAQRHQRVLELLLGKLVDHVGLVFICVRRLADSESSVGKSNDRSVMACRDIIRSEDLREL